MAFLSSKMCNAIFLLLLIEHLLAKDIQHLKQINIINNDNSDRNNISPDDLNENHLDQMEIFGKVSENNSNTNNIRENLMVKIPKEKEKANQLTDRSQHESDSNLMNYSLELTKSYISVFLGMISNFFSDLIKSIQVNFITSETKSSQTEFQKDFAIFKFFVFLIIIVVFIYLIINLFRPYLIPSKPINHEKESNEINSNKKQELNCVITLPFEDMIETPENQAIKLRGRTKRIPQPINYNELFYNNKKISSKGRDINLKTQIEIFKNNKKINNNIQEAKKQEINEPQIISSIDDLFDKYVYKTEIPQLDKLKPIFNDSIVTDNPNLILFDENKNNLVDNCIEQRKYSDLNEIQVKEDMPNLNCVFIDDRTKLLDRLKKGNFLEKTVISCMK